MLFVHAAESSACGSGTGACKCSQHIIFLLVHSRELELLSEIQTIVNTETGWHLMAVSS